jgi:chaperonin cofactor prefoldin
MSDPNVQNANNNPTPPRIEKKSVLSTTVFILLALLAVAGLANIWLSNEVKAAQRTREVENFQRERVLDSLENVRSGLEVRVDTLQARYSSLVASYETTTQKLNSANRAIAEKDKTIRSIKAKNTREEKALRAQISSLQAAKARYEALIDDLEQENARLGGRAEALSSQVSELSKNLEAQLKQTQSAQFRAINFKVEIERGNDRLTTRARRARELNISFDLNGVPAPFHGSQKLYLSITDDAGVPIESANPGFVTVTSPSGIAQIVVQQTWFHNLRQNQHIEYKYTPQERLKAGTYVVSVYWDQGLLGVTSFRLAR